MEKSLIYHQDQVFSVTLLYGSESWTTYALPELRMKYGRIFKDILYGEFITSKCNFGRPMKELNMELKNREDIAMEPLQMNTLLANLLKSGRKKFTVLDNRCNFQK